MRRRLTWLAILLAAVFVAIQLVPVDRSNPAVTGDLGAPPEIDAILRRSCYDCHSHETRWPWYSRVAPVSWLVASDVHEAREEMNFSRWRSLDDREQHHLREEIGEQVERGEMPLPIYLSMHPGARLDDGSRRALLDWAGGVDR